MPDLQTKIKLLIGEYPVTVTWHVYDMTDGAPDYEIEAVVSDQLGDVTDLVLNSLQGYTFVLKLPDSGWQDPIRTAMFGRPVLYDPSDSRVRPQSRECPLYVDRSGSVFSRPRTYVEQREPGHTVIRTFSALRQQIHDEIDDCEELPDAIQDYLDWLSEIQYD